MPTAGAAAAAPAAAPAAPSSRANEVGERLHLLGADRAGQVGGALGGGLPPVGRHLVDGAEQPGGESLGVGRRDPGREPGRPLGRPARAHHPVCTRGSVGRRIAAPRVTSAVEVGIGHGRRQNDRWLPGYGGEQSVLRDDSAVRLRAWPLRSWRVRARRTRAPPLLLPHGSDRHGSDRRTRRPPDGRCVAAVRRRRDVHAERRAHLAVVRRGSRARHARGRHAPRAVGRVRRGGLLEAHPAAGGRRARRPGPASRTASRR